MLLDLEKLVKKYKIEIDSVLHVGAHYGQESIIYDNLGIPSKKRHYFEPQPEVFRILTENIKDKGVCYNYALGNENKRVKMFIENDNQSMSSSVLKPAIHLEQYPHIRFTDEIDVTMIKLDDTWTAGGFMGSWLINADVQGFELEVLKGATKILPYTKCLVLEVNRAEVYEGCAKVEEIDEFLDGYGFKRVETNWEGISWGDAFYVNI